jgi:tetratricopeptide (TPR) repeat protein
LDLSEEEVMEDWRSGAERTVPTEAEAASRAAAVIVEEKGAEEEGPREEWSAEEEPGDAGAKEEEVLTAEGEVPPLPSVPPATEVPELAAAAVEELREEAEILEFYMVIKDLDFFTLLQLNPDASDEDVERAYRALRSKYYKNRFPPDLSSEALDKLEEIHAQIIRAFEELRTAEGRQAYRDGLKTRKEPAPMKDTLRAEQFLQRGMAFVRKRDWPQAQAMFEQAVAANPTDPEYKGYLGWCIYSNTETGWEERRERAKVLLREALHLNPQMDSAHVFLGKIFKDEGKTTEAINEFELALLCNPKCREADRELKRHEEGEW